MRDGLQTQAPRSAGLVEVLDRVLDKGLVIAGDIKISLAEVELLTIRVRLLVCSLDKATEIGLDWWRYDRNLSPGKQLQLENDRLRRDVLALERRLSSIAPVAARRLPPVKSRTPRKRVRNAR